MRSGKIALAGIIRNQNLYCNTIARFLILEKLVKYMEKRTMFSVSKMVKYFTLALGCRYKCFCFLISYSFTPTFGLVNEILILKVAQFHYSSCNLMHNARNLKKKKALSQYSR